MLQITVLAIFEVIRAVFCMSSCCAACIPKGKKKFVTPKGIA